MAPGGYNWPSCDPVRALDRKGRNTGLRLGAPRPKGPQPCPSPWGPPWQPPWQPPSQPWQPPWQMLFAAGFHFALRPLDDPDDGPEPRVKGFTCVLEEAITLLKIFTVWAMSGTHAGLQGDKRPTHPLHHRVQVPSFAHDLGHAASMTDESNDPRQVSKLPKL